MRATIHTQRCLNSKDKIILYPNLINEQKINAITTDTKRQSIIRALSYSIHLSRRSKRKMNVSVAGDAYVYDAVRVAGIASSNLHERYVVSRVNFF